VDKERKLFLGCSGYFYKGWLGKFYPKDLKMSQWFNFYTSKFNTVEINSTFYRMPKPADLRRWSRSAPEGFVFSVKMNRNITHYKKFRNTQKEIKEFYDLIIENLEDKLGCVLIQLPPSYKKSEENLSAIIEQLNGDVKNVIEFRHKSWWSEEVYEKLRKFNLCFCSVSAPKLPEDLVVTAEYIYIRFHGKEKWYRYNYSDKELMEWARKIRSVDFTQAYIYFNNDFDANAPRNCERLKEFLK